MPDLSDYFKKREEMQRIYEWLDSHSLLGINNKEEYNRVWLQRMKMHRRLSKLLHET